MAHKGKGPPSSPASALSVRTPTARMKLGAFGESFARSHLMRLGYLVLATNLRLKAGEVDVLAQHGPTLVFIEVRTRRGGRLGTPEESITPKKASRMARLAEQHMASLAVRPQDWRVDVIAIDVGKDGRVSRFAHIKNAVGEAGRLT